MLNTWSNHKPSWQEKLYLVFGSPHGSYKSKQLAIAGTHHGIIANTLNVLYQYFTNKCSIWHAQEAAFIQMRHSFD